MNLNVRGSFALSRKWPRSHAVCRAAIEGPVTPEDDYRLYAQRIQFWRLCDSALPRRVPTGAIRSAIAGGSPIGEAVKAAAQRERDARDPEAEA